MVPEKGVENVLFMFIHHIVQKNVPSIKPFKVLNRPEYQTLRGRLNSVFPKSMLLRENCVDQLLFFTNIFSWILITYT